MSPLRNPLSCCFLRHSEGLSRRGRTVPSANLRSPTVRPLPIEGGQVNPRNPDASFTLKNDETSFGCKAHLAVDEESRFLRLGFAASPLRAKSPGIVGMRKISR